MLTPNRSGKLIDSVNDVTGSWVLRAAVLAAAELGAVHSLQVAGTAHLSQAQTNHDQGKD